MLVKQPFETNLNTAFYFNSYSLFFPNSAVHGPAWPESRGFGLARAGFGFVKSQARPKPPVTAWLRLGLAQAAAFEGKIFCNYIFIYCTKSNLRAKI